MEKLKKDHKTRILSYLVIGIVLFQIGLFSSVNAAAGKRININGYYFQGIQKSTDGTVQYEFQNQLRLNISTSSSINLNISIDEKLKEHTFGIEIFTNTGVGNTYINLSATSTSNNEFKGNLKKWDKGIGRNPGQKQTDDTFEIDKSPELYFHMIFSNTSDFEKMTLFYEPQNQKATTMGWAYFDPVSNEWYILESEVKDGILYADLSADKNQEILVSANPEITTGIIVAPITLEESIWTNPILISLLVAIGLFALIMTNTEYRQFILNRTIYINRGVHKHLTIKQVLENEHRDKIINTIQIKPGIHFNDLQRKIGISGGNLAWHIDVLETFKIIKKQRIGQYLVFQLYIDKNPISHVDFKLQKSKTTLAILKVISDNPGIYNSKIAAMLKLNHKTISYHISKLIEAEVIYKDGRFFYTL